MEVKELLMCPRCRGELDEQYKCQKCGHQYEAKMGVYNILYEDLGEDYYFSSWSIDEADIKKSAEEYDAFRAEYAKHLTPECVAAEKAQDEVVAEIVRGFSGVTVDIATGRGMFLRRIMEWNPRLNFIGTDIDARVLAVTKVVRNCGDNVAFLGTDGRHLALKDECVDHVVSFVGIANMPETDKVIGEIYRVLKKGGTFLYKGAFMERDGAGYQDLKENFHLEHVMDLELLTQMMKQAGFTVEKSEVVASGTWGENPYDRYPFTGDKCLYGVIWVRK